MPAKKHPALALIHRAIKNAGFRFVTGPYEFSFKVFDAGSDDYSWIDAQFSHDKDEVTLIVDRLRDHATNHRDVVRALHHVTLAFDPESLQKSALRRTTNAPQLAQAALF